MADVDIECIDCGKKCGKASKPTRDKTDTSKDVVDYAVLCNSCASLDHKKLKKKTQDKMKTDEKLTAAVVTAEKIG